MKHDILFIGGTVEPLTLHQLHNMVHHSKHSTRDQLKPLHVEKIAKKWDDLVSGQDMDVVLDVSR